MEAVQESSGVTGEGVGSDNTTRVGIGVCGSKGGWVSLERTLGRARVWGYSGEWVLVTQVEQPLGPRWLWIVPLWGRHPSGGCTSWCDLPGPSARPVV